MHINIYMSNSGIGTCELYHSWSRYNYPGRFIGLKRNFNWRRQIQLWDGFFMASITYKESIWLQHNVMKTYNLETHLCLVPWCLCFCGICMAKRLKNQSTSVYILLQMGKCKRSPSNICIYNVTFPIIQHGIKSMLKTGSVVLGIAVLSWSGLPLSLCQVNKMSKTMAPPLYIPEVSRNSNITPTIHIHLTRPSPAPLNIKVWEYNLIRGQMAEWLEDANALPSFSKFPRRD
jgi:hypothetical protein